MEKLAKLGKVLFNKYTLSIVVLIVLMATVWFVLPKIAFSGCKLLYSESSRSFVMIGLVFVWGVVSSLMVVFENSKSKDANEIERKERKETEEKPIVINEKKRKSSAFKHEKDMINYRFRLVFGNLWENFFGRNNKLHELPKLIMLGLEGSGKTNLLINSGEMFPKLNEETKLDAKETDKCNWWVGNKACVLDVTGKYMSATKNDALLNAEWLYILNLLKKYHRIRPIDGIVLCCDINDVLTKDKKNKEKMIENLHFQLHTLQQKLGYIIPVYLFFTKVDKVLGFNEYFDDLNTDEARQSWGLAFSQGQRPGEYFANEFDTLLRRLNDKVIYRIAQERDAQRSSLIAGFPLQMANIKSYLGNFISDLCYSVNQYDPISLRGVYFTSAEQSNLPVDYLLGKTSSNFGLIPYKAEATSKHSRPYFIQDTFNTIISK